MDKTLEKDRINEMIVAIMKVARGDYSIRIELSGKNDDIDSLAMGLNMMIDDIRVSIEEVEKAHEERIKAKIAADKARLEESEKARKIIEEKAKKLEDSRSATIYMMKDLKRTSFDLEKKIRDLERFQKVTMDREKRVLELKKEIKELKKQLESKKE